MAETVPQEDMHNQPTVEAANLMEVGPRENRAELPFSSPQIFGNYELLSEVARGGMGIVYRARQATLNRIVALKMILAGRLADQEDVQRFLTEAEAAAGLKHPNIVMVHEVGEIEGQYFFSMEFIEGCSLAQKMVCGPMPGKLAARYVGQTARAVHYAHRQGILHRDLKPSNIMIDAQDEPHITDFGLAKRLGTNSGQTRTGTILGTPSYMAPEQGSGRSRELGPACDIYGLGAVLYELITGRPPFQAETPLDTVIQVLHNDPVPPSLLNSKIDHDLETICLKCLEKKPGDRYPSAEALADDLQRYQIGESISARSFNVLDRLLRTMGRSNYDAAFHSWSTLLLLMALIVGVENVVVFLLTQTGQPPWAIMTTRLVEFSLLGFLFWAHRGSRLLPNSPAERELWSIWIGFFLAYFTSFWLTRAVVAQGLLVKGENAPLGWEDLIGYPIKALVSGMAFFYMGCNYWGRCYFIGIVFFLLALAMPLHLEYAPLEFGLLWSMVLWFMGLHLRRLSVLAEMEQEGKLS